MRTPLRSLPQDVARWASRLRRLRWLDALVAWLIIWCAAISLTSRTDAGALASGLGVLVALGATIQPIRRRWRPITAFVSLALGWRLRPGDRAWHLGPDGPRPVLVTASAWRYLVVAGVVDDAGEGLRLRRTRAKPSRGRVF